jgi:hypothetical protein
MRTAEKQLESVYSIDDVGRKPGDPVEDGGQESLQATILLVSTIRCLFFR